MVLGISISNLITTLVWTGQDVSQCEFLDTCPRTARVQSRACNSTSVGVAEWTHARRRLGVFPSPFGATQDMQLRSLFVEMLDLVNFKLGAIVQPDARLYQRQIYSSRRRQQTAAGNL